MEDNLIKNDKINVFIVGAAKCGTTFLLNQFINHPDISIYKDECHYFDYHLKKNINIYNKLYNFNDCKKLYIDKTPSYCFIPGIIEEIHKYNKHAKIIFCYRNHYDRILSHINMNRHNRIQEKRNICDIINNELNNFNKQIDYESSQKMYIKRSMYFNQIKNIFKFFNKTQVYLFNLDDYNLNNLYNFLNVQVIDEITLVWKKKRVSVEKNEDELIYLKNHTKLKKLINEDIELLKLYNINIKINI